MSRVVALMISFCFLSQTVCVGKSVRDKKTIAPRGVVARARTALLRAWSRVQSVDNASMS